MDIVLKAVQNIKDKREHKQNVANKNLLALRSDNKFATLEGEIAGLEQEKTRKEIYKIDLNNIDFQINKLKNEYNKILNEKNIDINDLEPKYDCKNCNDTGYEKGKLCKCVKKEIKRIQYEKYSNLKEMPKNIKNINFDIYKENEEYFNKIFQGLYKRINNIENDLSIFTLQGEAGIGKSYIANFFAKQFVEKDKIIEIFNAIKLNKLFLEYHLAPIEQKENIFSDIINCDLLVIDDLGVEQILNNVTKPYLYQVLIERLGKKTLITTNLSLRNLENKYDQRIFSRLMDKKNSLVIQIKGDDLRLK